MSSEIKYPGKHDVMLGRGGESNYHSGNIAFRHMVQQHKERFRLGSRKEKNKVIDEVVNAWRNQDPVGRFVAKKKLSNGDVVWYDVGDELAKKRAAKSLAEWTPPPSSQSAQQHKRQRSDETLQGQRPGQLKSGQLKRSRSDGPASPDFSVALVNSPAPFCQPSMGSPSSIGNATLGNILSQQTQQPFPGLPSFSLPPSQPQANAAQNPDMLLSSSVQQQQQQQVQPQLNLAPQPPQPPQPQEDYVMSAILNSASQISNLNTSTGVLPIERIRLNIPTAAELSAEVFSDEDNSDRSNNSQESNKSRANNLLLPLDLHSTLLSGGVAFGSSWYHRLSPHEDGTMDEGSFWKAL